MRFVKPSPEEQQRLMDESTYLYGEEMFRYGEFKLKENAIATAQQEVKGHLADLKPPAQMLFFVLEDEKIKQNIGYIWFNIFKAKTANQQTRAFLAYIFINEEQRRKGYAQIAMQRYETMARSRGAKKSILNVFQGNTAAMNFYKKLGYTIIDELGYYEARGITNTRCQMLKSL